jgi:DNA gyrase inhibitor GyrI
VWRTGANEATVFETSKAVKINGKELPAGKYGLFTISGKDNWTIIFNKTWKQWGAFSYKQADDALRVEAKAQKTTAFAKK